MEITVLASGSAGNCYIISDGASTLLLEAGIPLERIRKGLRFRLNEVAGVLISHEHGDHARAAGELLHLGRDIYTSAGTARAVGISGYRVKTVAAVQPFSAGTFRAVPFGTEHDAAEPLGFLLYSTVTRERLLFATDTYYLKNRFPPCDYYMIECNYINALVSVETPDALAKRLYTSHMSLETCLDFLAAQDLSSCKKILLLHLSNDRANAAQMLREVRRLTGKEVEIA